MAPRAIRNATLTLANYWRDFVGLLFPVLCNCCGQSLVRGEHMVCLSCYHDLPFTDFHMVDDNPVAKRFWGRVELQSATALLHFQKGNKVQHLVHELKYKDNPDVGVYLGELLGKQLTASPGFNDVDVIVPVPLHWRKQFARGYNQSACFAEGIANVMGVKAEAKLLLRASHTTTQTKKTREERWLNVKDVFELKKPERYANQHILLVDDVITTGATLDACAQKLLAIPGAKISIATIAVAD